MNCRQRGRAPAPARRFELKAFERRGLLVLRPRILASNEEVHDHNRFESASLVQIMDQRVEVRLRDTPSRLYLFSVGRGYRILRTLDPDFALYLPAKPNSTVRIAMSRIAMRQVMVTMSMARSGLI